MTAQERYDLFMSTKLKDIISKEFENYLIDNNFFISPASTKYHGSYTGGLFDHSFATMNILNDLSVKNNLDWKRAESPFIVGMFHDLCKIDNYKHPIATDPFDESECVDNFSWEYNPHTILKGHGDKSIFILSQFMTLTEEEVACIRYHMGAFSDKSEWRDYTFAVHNYANVLWTHHADMMASHIEGV